MDNHPPLTPDPVPPPVPAAALSPAAPIPAPAPPSAVASQPIQTSLPPAARQPLFPVIMILAVLIGGSLAGLGGGLALRSYLRASSYQSAIQQFITAMQQNDKATADSLESPAAKAFLQKNLGTTSFYDVCTQEGLLCTATFKPSYLAKATKTYKSYKAVNGTEGKAVTYTIKESLSGAQAGGPGCSSKSTSTVTFDVVPSGGKWLIDNLDENTNANADLCLVPNGSSSTGN